MDAVPGTLAAARVERPLRAWQAQAASRVLDWWQDAAPESAVIHAVMGAGKTDLTGALVASWQAVMASDEVAVVTVPTRNLVEQTSATLRSVWCGPKVGQFYDRAKDVAPVIVTTYDSASTLAEQLSAMRRRVRFVIADECHQTENPRGHGALESLKCPVILGLSATPYRSAKNATLQLFSKVLYKYSPSDGLRDGVIVPYDVIPADVDFVSDNTDDVCIDMIRKAVGHGPGVVNAVTIADAEAFAKRLMAEGIRAAAAHSKLGGTVHDESTALGQRVRWLRMGKIQALVYPTLLSEGVDLPWLRWLCARRKIASRVRFAQEVGRILRAHAGKDVAYLYDPHDLSHSLALDYSAALGWQEDTPEQELHEAIDRDDVERIRELGEEFSELPPPKKLDVSTAFARRLANAWRQAGMLRQMKTAAWRQMDATPTHIAAVSRVAGDIRYHETEHTALFRAAIETASRGGFDRGTTTDLLEIMHIVHRAGAVWPRLRTGSRT